MATIDGTSGDDTLIGTSGADVMHGGAGNDTIDSAGGDDIIHGGPGNDVITDGPGDDTVYAEDGDDMIYGSSGNDYYDGGSSLYSDYVIYSAATAGIVVDMGLSADQVHSSGSTDAANVGVDTLVGIEGVVGSSFDDVMSWSGPGGYLNGAGGNDTLSGGAANDALAGGQGNDHINGGSGDDFLTGGAGDDVLNGGDGFDTASYGDAQVGVAVDLSLSGPQDTGGAGIDTLSSIEDLTGSSFDDRLTGTAESANLLFGGAGNDVLTGGLGDDGLEGGDGSDTYIIRSANEHPVAEITDDGQSPTDIDVVDFTATTRSTLTLFSGDRGIEAVYLGQARDGTTALSLDAKDVSSSLTVYGNAGDNIIEGSHSADRLLGYGGDDNLFGYIGDDTLNGGAGTDRMTGGTGNDIYYVDAYGDKISENAGEGTDAVIASASYKLSDNVEKLTLAGSANLYGYGNELDNVLTGNSGANKLFGMDGNDTLNGGAGTDRMAGGLGNDRYFVDSYSDRVIENAGEGADSVYASASYKLAANIETLTLTGTADLWGYGNELDNVLTGNDGANKLYGLGSNDTIKGGAGNDWIEGGAGKDMLYGGTGSDTFAFHDGDFGGAAAATADRILDFSQGEDQIRLNFVDADTGLAGDQAFHFMGTAAFDGHAGELRYEQISGATYVSGDTNGDGMAEFMIRVDGLQTLTAHDFVL